MKKPDTREYDSIEEYRKDVHEYVKFLENRVSDFEKFLKFLDNRGRLGLEIHAKIRKILNNEK